MITVIQILTAAVVALIAGLYWTTSQIGVKSAEIKTLTVERDHAKAEAKTLVDATRRHSEKVAKSSIAARRVATVVSRVPSDGCLDHHVAPDVLDSLRVRDSTKADPAAPGRRKTRS